MHIKKLIRAISTLFLCLLGGALMAGVIGLVWPLPHSFFVIAALFFGVVPWLSLMTPTGRTAKRRSRDSA
jgi:hypothetical protein